MPKWLSLIAIIAVFAAGIVLANKIIGNGYNDCKPSDEKCVEVAVAPAKN